MPYMQLQLVLHMRGDSVLQIGELIKTDLRQVEKTIYNIASTRIY